MMHVPGSQLAQDIRRSGAMDSAMTGIGCRRASLNHGQRTADALSAVTLHDWLRRRGLSDPDRAALTFRDETLTFAQLDYACSKLASLLYSHGFRQGDRIAYLGFNHALSLISLFASARLGLVFVPLNYRLTPAELGFIAQDAGVSGIIADSHHRPQVDQIRAAIDCRLYLSFGSDAEDWHRIDIASASSEPAPAVEVRADDTALIVYTSGTTGKPKGAELTHHMLWANNINWTLSIATRAEDVGLNCAPLFHVGGLCVVVLPVLMAGGHVVLQENFDPPAFIEALQRHRVTLTFAVPAMMQALCQLGDFDKADLSTLRLFIAGGASVPEPLLRRYMDRGILVSQGWGMTESATAVTFLSPANASAKLGSCGKAVMLSEFRLVDRDEREITAPGVSGEVRLRGLNVMSRYWNRPEATSDAFDADGWFRSGDIGYVDADGFLYICDRLKDMIISGGENIYSAEVEGVLYGHPSVLEVAVVGVPDPQWGERVAAVVVPKPDQSLALEDLRDFGAQQLARYKLPRELHLIEALPRNSSGKVLKYELRVLLTNRRI
jgi:fatty-acyl-CoA synthase